ncbi:MAG: PHP domain-containing protein [Bdellovibrionota bacterium]
MEFLADLHVHSNFSDGKLSISELVDFYGSRGFGAIAVTDHVCEDRTFLGVAASYLNLSLTSSSFSKYLEILHVEGLRAWRKYRMVVIPGFELSKNSWFNHRSAHVLGLGVTSFVEADGDIPQLARAIRSQGAVSVAAHPVSTGKFEPQTFHLWSRRCELEREFDAWEVASGPRLFEEVLESGLPLLASSDFHHPGHIEAWKTVFDCERHQEAILDAIRDQNLTFRFYHEPRTAFAPLPTLAP